MSEPAGSFPPPSSARGFAPPAPVAPVSEAAAPPAPVAPDGEAAAPPRRFGWRLNALLFVATVASVLAVGRVQWASDWAGAAGFAVPLLAILVAHELGHYVAARLHRVPASLPYFIPLPFGNPFGTLGAVILMPGRIRSRNALLDVGASGPLAGMVLAVPIMIWGLARSPVLPAVSGPDAHWIQEGQCLLYWALKALVHGPIPEGRDVFLHPTALAAWAGLFVTFLNLVPVGQLDGGHVAYALFGERQNRLARVWFWGPLAMVAWNAWVYVAPVVRRGLAGGFSALGPGVWLPASAVTLWVALFALLVVMRLVSGVDHPPVDDHRLTRGRRAVAALTLALFVALFMPSPWVQF